MRLIMSAQNARGPMIMNGQGSPGAHHQDACVDTFACDSTTQVKLGSPALNMLTLPRRRALLLSGGALAAPMIASGIARAANDWPNKPVRYINLFPAGGPTDVLSRIACQKLSELTGQQFIVDNKGGSGGNGGAEAIAHSAPDGYT